MCNLRAIRIALGMTQRQVADVFGQTASNVSHYETGKQELPPACARALIDAAKMRGREVSFDDIYVLPKLGADETTALQGGRAENALRAVADGDTAGAIQQEAV